MGQIPAQLVSKSAMGTKASIDPEYPISVSATNINNPTESTAVGIKPLADTQVLKPTSAS